MPDLRQALPGGEPSLLFGSLPRCRSQPLALGLLRDPRSQGRGRRGGLTLRYFTITVQYLTRKSTVALRVSPDTLRRWLVACLWHAKPLGEAWWTEPCCLTINRRSLKPRRLRQCPGSSVGRACD